MYYFSTPFSCHVIVNALPDNIPHAVCPCNGIHLLQVTGSLRPANNLTLLMLEGAHLTSEQNEGRGTHGWTGALNSQRQHHTPCSGAMWDHCTTLPAVVPCGTTAPHSQQWCHVGPTAPYSLQWCHVGPLHHTPCSGAMWDPLHHTHYIPVSKPSLVSSQACSVRLSHVTHKSAPVCCHGNT